MKDKKNTYLPVGEQITEQQLQLIMPDGTNIGLVSRQKALQLANEAGLDLVMLAKEGGQGTPIVKVMDFGRLLYEKKKKKAASKKHQKVIQVKEIKFRPKIGEHDYQTKIKRAVQFLKAGKRVKITLFFRGRENIAKEERGSELFQRISQSFQEYDLAKNLVTEKDAKAGQIWSRIYYLKT